MLNKIIQFSINNKLIVGLFVFALVVYGSYQVTKLPIDAVPDITDNQVQIITVSSSLGAVDVERLITIPVEQATSNISGLKQTRSFSRFGLSVITLVFHDNVDLFWARQQVAERLVQVQGEIPPGIELPHLGPITTGLGEIYQYVVKAKPGYEDEYSLTDLRTIQDWTIRKQMLGTKGVADVSSFGGKLKQYEISVNPDQLKSTEVTMEEIFTALELSNENAGGAYIERGASVLTIRSEGLLQNKSEIENIVIKYTADNIPVKINDVAKVKIGFATRYGALTYNDEGEVAGGVVMMVKGANSSEVIVSVKKRMAEIQKTLPEGVVIEPFLDRSKMVNNAIHTVLKNLLEGALIVVLVLVLFLGNFRAGFIVASVIPLSMLFTIIMMNIFGVSGNLMSLGAIDFGLIVDGAVIIVEAVLHGLTHSKKGMLTGKISQSEMDEHVKKSSSRMMNAAVFGQIIILIVYLPILTLEGIEGKMFKPMAITVAFAITGAFLLSLTYVPMITSLVLSKKSKHKKNLTDRLMDGLEYGYQRMLLKSLRGGKWIFIGVITIFSVAIFLGTRLGGEFIPTLEEGDFAVETRLTTGSNLNISIDICKKAGAILQKFPEVEKVVAKIGSGEIPTDPMPMEAADLMIILKDKSKWTTAHTFNDLAAIMGDSLAQIPGVSFGFQYPVQMRFNELMTGSKQDVVCKLYGDNLDSLALYAGKIAHIVETVKGTTDLYVETVTGIPEIVVKYKRNMLDQYGLTIKTLNNILGAAFAGKKTGIIFEQEKRFDMIVRMDESKRKDVNEIRQLLINTPSGAIIPLEQVADIKEIDGPNQIQRENARKRIVVGFNVRGRDVQSLVTELQAKIDSTITFPAGYEIGYGGSFENLQKAKQRLSIAVPVSLALIFLLLYFAFSSIKTGVLIYSAIPLSAIGGIFALWLRGMPFSISAGIGFIALFGVAVLNGIVLISEYKRIIKEGGTNFIRTILLGSKNRLRPVLMTAAVASLGFIPMALSNGAGAEVQKPLATVVIGGLISATFLTLFLLPSLFLASNRKRNSKLKKLVLPLVILMALPFSVQAQTTYTSINLQQAIEKGLETSLSIKSSSLLIDADKAVEKSSFSPEKLQINVGYGHINSSALDNSFSFAQSIEFPSVYFLQEKVFKQNTQISRDNQEVIKLELTNNIKYSFYRILLLQEKLRLLATADSIYSVFLKKVEQKFQVGETDILEQTMATTQQMQIKIQHDNVAFDLSKSIVQFNYYMGSNNMYLPEKANTKYKLTVVSDTNLNDHPKIKILEHQSNLLKFEWKRQKSRLLPGFYFNYYNMSTIGWQNIGNGDIFFNSGDRFWNITGGIQVPLFFWGQAATIKSSKLMFTKSLIDLERAKYQFRTDYQLAEQEFERAKNALDKYEVNGLPQSGILEMNAQQQYNAGNISYIEWAYLINQSVQIRNAYLDAVNDYNNAIFQLELFSIKK